MVLGLLKVFLGFYQKLKKIQKNLGPAIPNLFYRVDSEVNRRRDLFLNLFLKKTMDRLKKSGRKRAGVWEFLSDDEECHKRPVVLVNTATMP